MRVLSWFLSFSNMYDASIWCSINDRLWKLIFSKFWHYFYEKFCENLWKLTKNQHFFAETSLILKFSTSRAYIWHSVFKSTFYGESNKKNLMWALDAGFLQSLYKKNHTCHFPIFSHLSYHFPLRALNIQNYQILKNRSCDPSFES